MCIIDTAGRDVALDILREARSYVLSSATTTVRGWVYDVTREARLLACERVVLAQVDRAPARVVADCLAAYRLLDDVHDRVRAARASRRAAAL